MAASKRHEIAMNLKGGAPAIYEFPTRMSLKYGDSTFMTRLFGVRVSVFTTNGNPDRPPALDGEVAFRIQLRQKPDGTEYDPPILLGIWSGEQTPGGGVYFPVPGPEGSFMDLPANQDIEMLHEWGRGAKNDDSGITGKQVLLTADCIQARSFPA